MFDSVLIAVDGSENAKKALSVACKLVRGEQSKLHILHIPEALTHETTLVWGIGAVPMESTQEVLEEAGREVIVRATDAAREMGAQQIETHLARGEPARTILRQAELLGVDAIVMGSRGLGDLGGFILGSVSHKVSHSAKCTVITVR
ncbi:MULTISPECIES: universal stress protein [Halomonadaceae]|uniref:universal stress protein n=1 Tax=Halomonadaceae TaxID=28256 RepID=UPI00159AE88D|nr:MULTISPECIES: universal stress protein [Halomonas]QJQ95772.1 universal stress protein [Halomonas sp. PA5]